VVNKGVDGQHESGFRGNRLGRDALI
jgi:hypothetical protein